MRARGRSPGACDVPGAVARWSSRDVGVTLRPRRSPYRRRLSDPRWTVEGAPDERPLAGRSDFDPDVEWDASEIPAPDIGGVYRDPEGVRQFWREWLAAWETVQFECGCPTRSKRWGRRRRRCRGKTWTLCGTRSMPTGPETGRRRRRTLRPTWFGKSGSGHALPRPWPPQRGRRRPVGLRGAHLLQRRVHPQGRLRDTVRSPRSSLTGPRDAPRAVSDARFARVAPRARCSSFRGPRGPGCGSGRRTRP
jgi:hypothetical protein